MLKESGLTGCPVELVCRCMGGGDLEMLLESITNNSVSFSYILNGTVDHWHLYWYMTPLFCNLRVLVLRGHKKILNGIGPFEMYLCHPKGRTQSTISTSHQHTGPHIQFTVEEPNQHGSLPFLDTKVTPGLNNTLSTTVYR